MIVRVGPLPSSAVEAAARFHGEVAPGIVDKLASGADAVIVFEPADYTHRAWRLAAVQGLAREHAPVRVNAVAGNEEMAIRAAADFLGRAPGVTGQYLVLDGSGAGDPAN